MRVRKPSQLDLTKKPLHWQIHKGKEEQGIREIFCLPNTQARRQFISLLSFSLSHSFAISFSLSSSYSFFLSPSLPLSLCVIASICSPGIDGVNTLLTHATVRHWHLWEKLLPQTRAHAHKTCTHALPVWFAPCSRPRHLEERTGAGTFMPVFNSASWTYVAPQRSTSSSWYI